MKWILYFKLSLVPFILVLLASCSGNPPVNKQEAEQQLKDSLAAKKEEPLKRDCALLATAKEIGLPLEDTLGIYGNELSKKEFLSMNLDSVMKYDSTLRYTILGKVTYPKFTVALFSYTSSGESAHWLVSYNSKTCAIIDKEQTAYGDQVEYYSETRSRILKDEIRLTTKNYDYNGPKEKMKKTLKVYTISEDGKFVRGL